MSFNDARDVVTRFAPIFGVHCWKEGIDEPPDMVAVKKKMNNEPWEAGERE